MTFETLEQLELEANKRFEAIAIISCRHPVVSDPTAWAMDLLASHDLADKDCAVWIDDGWGKVIVPMKARNKIDRIALMRLESVSARFPHIFTVQGPDGVQVYRFESAADRELQLMQGALAL